jgi:hypothetical protein
MTLIVIYLLVGKLVVFAIQKFPLDKLFFIGKFFQEGKFLEQLWKCDFCLGFWVYTFLAFAFPVNYLNEYVNVPILNQALTGLISSFVMHLISIGWKDKFGTFELK